jgi:Tol biopolymer transport system component
VGTPAGADPVFVISGTTNGTATGTNVTESYFSNQGTTEPPGNPVLTLVQSGPSGVLRSDAISASNQVSEHGSTNATTPPLIFSGAVPFNSAATQVQLKQGSTVLYTASRNPNGGALVQNVTVGGLTQYTHSFFAADQPAISPDGKLVAFRPNTTDQCRPVDQLRRLRDGPRVGRLLQRQRRRRAGGVVG